MLAWKKGGLTWNTFRYRGAQGIERHRISHPPQALLPAVDCHEMKSHCRLM
ncbi:hypothetical protein PS928_01994 [Pseudomonas fluorescens]|uniref:Uncharacterized protein n=1 Tax=Pseudomonas fluorescens TaxID=294 RepID=A0A5E7T6T2_PSEFL|nr:hypothetical protein PS928_01994 [Pseudomonas fluorescens]